MIQYIYFVKCPNCEDEPFDFFDEAKGYALGNLSRKPIITQTEVCRNDFGECTDSSDLGTVWSWEDIISDTEEEPLSAFSKYETVGTDLDLNDDPEFTTLDNSLDDIPDNFRKPITENVDRDAEMRILAREMFDLGVECTSYEEFAGFMRENDDTPTEELYATYKDAVAAAASSSKGKAIPEGMTIEQLVEEMEENEDEVECAWCNELFDKSECRKEVDLGWLCSRCEAAIKSRGEPLTFRENNYWDFLDEEDAELTEASLADVAAAANAEFDSHWTSDDLLDMSGIAEEPRHMDVHTGLTPSEKAKADFAASQERSYKNKLAAWKRYKKQKTSEVLEESSNADEEIEFEYNDLTVNLQGLKRDVDDWDEEEKEVYYLYKKDKEDVAMDIWDRFITEEDAKDVPGGLETLEDDTEWAKFLATNWDNLLEKHYKELLDYYRSEATEEYENSHYLGETVKVTECDKTDSFLEALEEREAYDKRLTYCPECDTIKFDPETGICISCGFN